MDWADGFLVVYNISDRASFFNAKTLLQQIREARVERCKGSAAGSYSRGSVRAAAFTMFVSSSGMGNAALRGAALVSIWSWAEQQALAPHPQREECVLNSAEDL